METGRLKSTPHPSFGHPLAIRWGEGRGCIEINAHGFCASRNRQKDRSNRSEVRYANSKALASSDSIHPPQRFVGNEDSRQWFRPIPLGSDSAVTANAPCFFRNIFGVDKHRVCAMASHNAVKGEELKQEALHPQPFPPNLTPLVATVLGIQPNEQLLTSD